MASLSSANFVKISHPNLSCVSHPSPLTKAKQNGPFSKHLFLCPSAPICLSFTSSEKNTFPLESQDHREAFVPQCLMFSKKHMCPNPHSGNLSASKQASLLREIETRRGYELRSWDLFFSGTEPRFRVSKTPRL